MSDKKIKVNLSKGTVNLIANLLNSGYNTKDKELDDIFLYNDVFQIIGVVIKQFREDIEGKKDEEVEKMTAEKVEIEFSIKQLTFLSDTVKGIIKQGVNVNEFVAKSIRELFTEIGQ